MCNPSAQTSHHQPITQGLHHLGLNVPSVSETAEFLSAHLGFRVVGGKPDYPAIFVSDGTVMLTLWQVRSAEAVTFDHQAHIGLHHFALQVADVEALLLLHQRLAQLEGVTMEFAPEPLSGTPIQHMMCWIPGGLRVEFLALPEAAQ